jgi:hypothetical protein
MAIVAVAIVLSFHLKSQPTAIELRMARPLGIIFWLLSLSCLLVGFGNYIRELRVLAPTAPLACFHYRCSSRFLHSRRGLLICCAETVNKYSRKVAIVQAGWKTQSVSGRHSACQSSAMN